MSKKIEKLNKELEDLETSIEEGTFSVVTATGKPKSPNLLRSEIRAFLAATGMGPTKFCSEIGVNSNSYGKFMKEYKEGTYKNQWSAVENG